MSVTSNVYIDRARYRAAVRRAIGVLNDVVATARHAASLKDSLCELLDEIEDDDDMPGPTVSLP